MKRILCIALLLGIALPALADKPASQLPPDARVAIIGDSITEQRLYSKFIETYLLACSGRKDIKCFQFGWGGETASAFKYREENDLRSFHPTVATFCYGMNDGHYVPFTDTIGKDYETNMKAVINKARAIGVTNVIIGTPGAVDTRYFIKPGATAEQYNESLQRLGEIDRKLANDLHAAFADVHREMMEAMSAAKAAINEEYDVCGRDGVHPGPNGHLLMAAAFLKAMALDGNIGDITVDLKGPSVGSDGHRVSGRNGTADVESTKWPFCFEGESSNGTRSILPFCRFNDELNRYTLRVKNLEAPGARITWGTESREFAREQLAQGINLTAEFKTTPFDRPFLALMNAVKQKQEFETPMIKGMITNFRGFLRDSMADPEFAAALDTLKKKLIAKQQKLDAAARALVVPVKHTIKVEALK
jgi:lysophospholipase L1-like esterase